MSVFVTRVFEVKSHFLLEDTGDSELADRWSDGTKPRRLSTNELRLLKPRDLEGELCRLETGVSATEGRRPSGPPAGQ